MKGVKGMKVFDKRNLVKSSSLLAASLITIVIILNIVTGQKDSIRYILLTITLLLNLFCYLVFEKK